MNATGRAIDNRPYKHAPTFTGVEVVSDRPRHPERSDEGTKSKDLRTKS